MRVTLPEGYPAVPPAVEMDVPTQPEVVGAGRSSLVDVKAACEAVRPAMPLGYSLVSLCLYHVSRAGLGR